MPHPAKHRIGHALRAVALALAVAGAGSLTAAPVAAHGPGAVRAGDVVAAISIARVVARYLVSPLVLLDPYLQSGRQLSHGHDGRLTVLLLGSDYRPTLPGDRTDVVLVMSIDVATGAVSALSIPRDVSRLPMPDGSVSGSRVNTLYAGFVRDSNRAQAMAEVEKVIEHVLQIEIDYHAYIRFNGFNRLIEHVGGLTVRIPSAINDPSFTDDPTKPAGIHFPQADAWRLAGGSVPACNGLYKVESYSGQPGYRCERALVYARTRKGAGNSDFKRAGRHQQLAMSAISRVVGRERGLLRELIGAVRDQQAAGDFYTNVPLDMATAETLFQLAERAHLERQVVFAPPSYASRVEGVSAYQLQLDVAAVRALTRSWFGESP